VNPGATDHVEVVGFPNPATAGVSGFVNVTAKDQFNNRTPAYRGTVRVTSSDGNGTLPPNYTYVAADAGTHTFSVVLKTASAAASITATDTQTPALAGSQVGIVVNPGATATLRVTGFPNPIFAGTPGFLTVTADDAFGNVTPAYRGTIRVSSSDPISTLPPDHAFIAADAGVHTFVVILNSPSGSASIRASDNLTLALTGVQSGIVVNVGPLLFGSTATAIDGGARAGQIFIAGGNTKADGTGTTVAN